MNDAILNGKINVFFAYAREDHYLRERIDKHLSTLKRTNYINTWFDGEIIAGTEWEAEINLRLSKADIILLLISVDFIASDYCYDVELRKALIRHENGEAVVIPIILCPCDWQETAFAKLQVLPENGNPITDKSWEDKEVALRSVALGIKEKALDLLNQKKKQLVSISEIILEKEYEHLEKEDHLKSIQLKIEGASLELEVLQERIQLAHVTKASMGEELEAMKFQKTEMSRIISNCQIEINKAKSEIKRLEEEKQSLEEENKKIAAKLDNINIDIKRAKKEAYNQ